MLSLFIEVLQSGHGCFTVAAANIPQHILAKCRIHPGGRRDVTAQRGDSSSAACTPWTLEPYCADQTRGCCLHTLMHQGHTPLRPLWKACSTLSIRRMTWRLAKVPGPSPNRNRGGEKHQTVDVIRRPVIQTSSPEAHRLLTSQPTAFFSAGAPVPHTQGSDGRSCSMTSASLPIHYNE